LLAQCQNGGGGGKGGETSLSREEKIPKVVEDVLIVSMLWTRGAWGLFIRNFGNYRI